MNILAIDTAGAALSAALSSPEGTFLTEIDAGTRHSELLMEVIDGLFKTAGLKKSADLDAVACMKGPGSFTGLRIGYAAAKGLSLSLDIPLFTAPTLDCMAYPHSAWPGLVLPVMDAKKSCFFGAFYRGGERLTDFLDAGPDTLEEIAERCGLLSEMIFSDKTGGERIFMTGPAAGLLYPLLSDREVAQQAAAQFVAAQKWVKDPGISSGKARELLEIVKDSVILQENESEREDSGPFYLRKSDAELNLLNNRAAKS
jgi:tRNA threonylcarbamoyladenosine biosynthesis protein TsaB